MFGNRKDLIPTSKQPISMKRLGIRYQTLQQLSSPSDLLRLLNEVADAYWGQELSPLRSLLSLSENPSVLHPREVLPEERRPAFGHAFPFHLLPVDRGDVEGFAPLYRHFYIPKKSGDMRHIVAPIPQLRQLQQSVNLMLREAYTPAACVMGFVPHRSVATNASLHVGRRFVWNLDLQDFFPSIRHEQVLRALRREPFSLQPPVAEVLSLLCCCPLHVSVADPTTGRQRTVRRLVLPQGAPTSPILSNIVCQKLDRRLQGLAATYGATYSRYADDITFSSDSHLFSPRSAFVAQVREIIAQEGFAVNEKKVRLQSSAQRQEVTGLTVGTKVNVAKGYVKELRFLLHRWERYGFHAALAVYAPIYRERHPGSEVPPIENYLQGKLDYMRMVKGDEDPTTLALQRRLQTLLETPASSK